MPTEESTTRGPDFPPTVFDTQPVQGTTQSTTYTASLTGTGAQACAVVFVAPTSGKVEICNVAQAKHSSTNQSYCTFEVRKGPIVGSGDSVLAASDDQAIIVAGSGPFRFGISRELADLTPGSVYNVQQLFKVSTSSTTGTFNRKHLYVKPIP